MWMCDDCQTINDEPLLKCSRCGRVKPSMVPLVEKGVPPPAPYPLIVPPSLGTPDPTAILASDGLLTSQIDALQRAKSPWANYWINLVFFGLFSIICLGSVVHWLSDQHQSQRVMQECAGALSNPTLACHDENAMTRFEETISRHYGRHPHTEHYDYAYVNLFDGRQVTEQLVSRLSSIIGSGGVVGLQPCRVRLWHDQVIMISVDGRSVQTYDDPASHLWDDGSTAFTLGVIALAALIPWRRRSSIPLTDI